MKLTQRQREVVQKMRDGIVLWHEEPGSRYADPGAGREHASLGSPGNVSMRTVNALLAKGIIERDRSLARGPHPDQTVRYCLTKNATEKIIQALVLAAEDCSAAAAHFQAAKDDEDAKEATAYAQSALQLVQEALQRMLM